MADKAAVTAGGDIVDITDTPDVAVWAKGIKKKGAGAPSDAVKEPSIIASMTLHLNTKGGEIMVDPANKKEVAKALAERTSVTDESEYGK